MDLAVDKLTQLNILPRSKYELYQSILRQIPEPPIKQVGVPMSAEKRDMDMNTDEISYSDKEMQFCHGDDTAFFNIIGSIQRSRGAVHLEAKQSSTVEIGTDALSDSFETNARGAAQLTTFLNRAAYLFESSLPSSSSSRFLPAEEKASEKHSTSSKFSVFLKNNEWISLGGDKVNGANELISTRNAVSVRFSSLNPSLIISAYAYPPPEDDPDLDVDLKPFKVSDFYEISYP